MLRRLRFWIPAATSLVVLGVPALASADLRVAVVDVQEAMNATEHWKAAVARLQKQRAEKQVELESKQKELKQRKDKLDAQKAISDPNALASQEEQLFKDAQELTQGFLKTKDDLAQAEKGITEQMLTRIEAIVRDLALDGQFDFVFETGPDEQPNVLYAPKAFDLTARVIEQYKKRFKDKPLE